MIKRSIALHLRSLTNLDLAALGQIIHDGLTGNTVYTSLPVSLAAQQASVNELKAALVACGTKGGRGSHRDYLNLLVKRDVVRENLKILANYCMSVTPNDPLSWEAAGFVTKKLREKAGLPTAAAGVRQVFADNIP